MSMLDRIRHANELVSVYEFIEEVPSRGRPEQIHCPVHEDRRKSARVYPESNSVFCWTCGRPYDPVSILVETEGMSYAAACRYIEENAGVRWERQESEAEDFWRLVRKAGQDPDDPKHWSRKDLVSARWQIHETILSAGLDNVDWAPFDNGHLDIVELRRWRDSLLDGEPGQLYNDIEVSS